MMTNNGGRINKKTLCLVEPNRDVWMTLFLRGGEKISPLPALDILFINNLESYQQWLSSAGHEAGLVRRDQDSRPFEKKGSVHQVPFNVFSILIQFHFPKNNQI